MRINLKQQILEKERSQGLVEKEKQLKRAHETIDDVEKLRREIIDNLKTKQKDSSALIDKLTALTNQYQLLQQNTAYMVLSSSAFFTYSATFTSCDLIKRKSCSSTNLPTNYRTIYATS